MNYDLDNLFDQLKPDIPQETSTENSSKTEVCESCGSDDFVIDNGSVICKSCGMIQYNTIDSGAEWRF